ncbi:hypothetical protein HPULCUR_008770 [Helicostylum pulchrum]|uniref:Origin recognition complex subunit 3 n=1 Tax=Helicostylum pulchrum TaxID=562976 RepID=A0ABP9Y8J8_9FUNG
MPGKRRRPTTESKRTKKAREKNNVSIKQRAEQDSQEILNDGFQQLFNGQEPIESMLFRKDSFKKVWDSVNNDISDILLDMNHTAVESICQFVDKSHDVEESMVALPFHEIPTGLVFAGINTPDHDTQFAHIAFKLKEETTANSNRKQKNFVCLLQSKDCPNIKNMLRTMIERFLANTPNALTTDLENDTTMDNNEASEDDVEDDDDIIRSTERAATSYRLGGVAAKPSKCLPYDMKLLEGWYKHHQQSYTNKPNLVIILQDFESFEPAILQDFFTICSEYRSRLPIICIMGIATSTEILHQSLNKSTIGLLRIEKFKLEQSGVWFNRVIEKIFLDSTSTLKFGPRPYKFLLDHFYLYDFSMTKVTASIKYALMHHFYGNPLSIFLPLLQMDEFDMTATLQQWMRSELISEHHITHIRMLGSFKSYIESLVETDPKKALQLLEDDDYLIIEVIPSLLCDIKIYQKQFKMGFNLLVLLQTQFPSFSSLHKSRLMLLLEVLESKDGLGDNIDMVRKLVSFVRKIDTEHVGKLLKEIRQLLQDYDDVNNSFLDQVSIWDKRYEQLMEADGAYNARMNKKAKKLEGMVLENEGSRHTETAKKVQNESLEHLKRKGTEASKIAMDIADWCDKTLGHLLRSFTTLPLFELSFASQPRASVQTALTQPQHYLNCPCCNIEKSDQVIASEHDTCILYKLYLECGRLINLYDWFVAFGCVIEREKRPKNKALEENEVQARFIRSVAELQFLGFIKPTQRKTDHVIRLTWSNI